MQSVDGIADLRMAGTRATFKPEGSKVDEAKIAAAFEERGMKLESLEKVELPRPSARYKVDAGIT